MGSIHKLICASMQDGVVVMDVDTTVRYANPAVEKLLALSGAINCGRLISDSIPADIYKYFEWLLPVVVRTGSTRSATFSILGEGGEFTHINAVASVFPDDDGEEKLMLLLQDMTGQQNALIEAAQGEKLSAVGLLAAGIAHEFNNIWASVQGYAELAKQNLDFAKDLVNVVLEQSDRSTQIVHALLSFSDQKVEVAGGVRLKGVLGAILRLVEMELKANGVDAALEVEEDPVVSGNESMLQQIFLNLVINAYHAVDTKGKIAIKLYTDGEYAVVEVADNGRGMSAEEQARLFEPFFTTKGALGGSEEADGHGLGLTLTYNIVRSHRGTIEASSVEGEGSKFTVRLPLDKSETSKSKSVVVGSLLGLDRPLRVLVVDDEKILQMLVASILVGHEVSGVCSGEEALSCLEENEYDAVFLDIVLAGEVDGYGVLDFAEEKCPSTRVVILTGRPDNKRLSACRSRVHSVISKPFSVEDILGSLE